MAYVKYSRQLRKKIDSSLFWTVTKDISDSDGILEKGTDVYCGNISIYDYDRLNGMCKINVGNAYIEISEDKFDSYFSPNQNLNKDYILYEKKLAMETKLCKTAYILLWIWNMCYFINAILRVTCDFPASVFWLLFIMNNILWLTSATILCISKFKIIPKYEKKLADMRSIHNN